MKIRLLAVGTRMPAWVNEGVEEYRKRLPRDFTLEIEEIAPGQRGKNADVARAIALEAQRIRERLRGDELTVALEVQGKPWSTEQLARKPKPGDCRGATWRCWWAGRMAWLPSCPAPPSGAGRCRPSRCRIRWCGSCWPNSFIVPGPCWWGTLSSLTAASAVMQQRDHCRHAPTP